MTVVQGDVIENDRSFDIDYSVKNSSAVEVEFSVIGDIHIGNHSSGSDMDRPAVYRNIFHIATEADKERTGSVYGDICCRGHLAHADDG